MRADAQRSYDQIVVAAEAVFSEQGTEASLNEVAKRAHVGAGTLYRHFPNRDALLDVLMTGWTDRIQAAADHAVASGREPHHLLADWFTAVVDQISVHRGGPQRITAALGTTGSLTAEKAHGLVAANDTVLEHLRRSGQLREGVDSVQVCRLIGGVAASADQAHLDPNTTRELLDIIINGLTVGGGISSP